MRAFIGTFLILFFIVPLSGQDNGIFTTVSIHGGPSLPVDPPYYGSWGTGYNLGFSIGREFTHVAIIEAAFDFHRFDIINGVPTTGFGGVLPTEFVIMGARAAKLITVTIGGKVKFSRQPHPIEPYLTGGLGFFWLSIDHVISYVDGGSFRFVRPGDSDPVGYIGVGVNLPANERTDLFFQIAYESGFTSYQSTIYIPIKAGVAFRL